MMHSRRDMEDEGPDEGPDEDEGLICSVDGDPGWTGNRIGAREDGAGG